MNAQAVIFFVIGIATGFLIAYLLLSAGRKQLEKQIEKLSEEHQKERKELLNSFQDKLTAFTKQIEEQRKEISEKDRTIKSLEKILQDRETKINNLLLEKKGFQNLIQQLESKLKTNIPQEAVSLLSEIKQKIDQLYKVFKGTESLRDYSILIDKEHDDAFTLIVSSEKNILLTAPFLSTEAIKKRLPEIRSFLENGGEMYLVIGKNYNADREGKPLLYLLRELNGHNVKVFSGDIHHKVITGENRSIVTSYNFLSKNNRNREIGLLIDNRELAATLLKAEIENLKEYESISYAEFTVKKLSSSSSGKSLKIETDCKKFPVVYARNGTKIEQGNRYAAVLTRTENYTKVTEITQLI